MTSLSSIFATKYNPLAPSLPEPHPPIAERIEFLIRQTVREATDPVGLLAMGAAGMAFKLGKLWALGKTANTALPSLLRLSAVNGAGFVAETFSFTASNRLGNTVLDRSQDWNSSALWHEYAAGSLGLLGIKFGATLGHGVLQHWGSNLGPGLIRTIIPQAGLLLGISLGHRLEEHLQLRPAHHGDAAWIDDVASLLQLNLSTSLSRHAFGSKWQALERGLELQSQKLETQSYQTLQPLFDTAMWQRVLRRSFYYPAHVMLGAVGEPGGVASAGGAETELNAEELNLIAAIHAAPEETEPRKLYADYLTQRGEPRGELSLIELELKNRFGLLNPNEGGQLQVKSSKDLGDYTQLQSRRRALLKLLEKKEELGSINNVTLKYGFYDTASVEILETKSTPDIVVGLSKRGFKFLSSLEILGDTWTNILTFLTMWHWPPTLNTFDIQCPNLTIQDIETLLQLEGIPQLHNLRLTDSDVNEMSLLRLLRLPGLKRLELNFNNINIGNLGELPWTHWLGKEDLRLDRFEILDLAGNAIQAPEWNILRQFLISKGLKPEVFPAYQEANAGIDLDAEIDYWLIGEEAPPQEEVERIPTYTLEEPEE